MIAKPSDPQIITMCGSVEVGAEAGRLRCWLEVPLRVRDPFIPDCPELPLHQGSSPRGQSQFSLRPPGVTVTFR